MPRDPLSPAWEGETVYPGRNPDVGFLHCGGSDLTVNIGTQTGFGADPDTEALRLALDELARRAPLLVSRLRLLPHRFISPHNEWVVPPAGRRDRIPLELIDVAPGTLDRVTLERCAAGANLPIDARSQPPLRAELLRERDGSSRLVTTLHHGLYDGASVGFVYYLLKRLYVAARHGRDPSQVELPRIVTPRDTEFALRILGGPALTRRARLLALVARGWKLLLAERGFRVLDLPGRETAPGARSLHHTLFLDLDDPDLAGLGPLLAARGATLNELLQAASSRAFFDWGRDEGWVEDSLPFGSTYNVRQPSVAEYALGNFETATCVELRRAEVAEPVPLLEALVRRSNEQQRTLLPLGHYLALSGLVRAPTSRVPRIIHQVANRAVLLFSYLGADFARRYLGHFGRGEDEPEVDRLVRQHPGNGAGYVTSAPPMGMVITVKRVRRTVAANLSIHDRLTDQAGLERFAERLRDEVRLYASLAPPREATDARLRAASSR